MARHAIPFMVMAALCVVSAPAFAAGQVAAQQQQGQTREAFVGNVTGQVLTIIHNPGALLSTKKSQLENTFLQVVDLQWIAKYVMGKPWDAASEQQRKTYVALYGKYLSGTYLAGLDEKSEHNLQDIKVTGMEDAFDDAFLVHTQMVMAQGDNVAVDYMVRETGGQRKVIDITLEGVSLLRSHRSELGGLAASKGVDGVIAALQAKMETHVASAN